MHGLKTIIAMNMTDGDRYIAREAARIQRGEEPKGNAPKQASRDRFWAKRRAHSLAEMEAQQDAEDAIREEYGHTLADEAQDVIDLLSNTVNPTANEQQLLRFAEALLEAGVTGAPTFRERRSR